MLACVEGVSKKASEGNETASEFEKYIAGGGGEGSEENASNQSQTFYLPLHAHPLPTSPPFFAHPRRAPSLARLFDLSARKRKGKEPAATQANCMSNFSLFPFFWL